MLTKINSRYYCWTGRDDKKYILDQDENFRSLFLNYFHWNFKFKALRIDSQSHFDISEKKQKYIDFYVLWGGAMIFSVILRTVFKNIFLDNLIIRITLVVIIVLVSIFLKIYISNKQKRQVTQILSGTHYEIIKLKMIYLTPMDAIKCNIRNLLGYIYLLTMTIIGVVLILISNGTIPVIIFLISLSAYFILSNATIPGLKPNKETLNITFVEV